MPSLGFNCSLLLGQFVKMLPRKAHGLSAREAGLVSTQKVGNFLAHIVEKFSLGLHSRLGDGSDLALFWRWLVHVGGGQWRVAREGTRGALQARSNSSLVAACAVVSSVIKGRNSQLLPATLHIVCKCRLSFVQVVALVSQSRLEVAPKLWSSFLSIPEAFAESLKTKLPTLELSLFKNDCHFAGDIYTY